MGTGPSAQGKMSVEELQKLAPAFAWGTYFAKVGVGSLGSQRGTLNVVTPDYFHVMKDEIEKESLADWKIYLRRHAVHDASNYPVVRLRQRAFQFLRQDIARTRGTPASLEALYQRCG